MGNETALNISANQAGYQGSTPPTTTISVW
jgi:hypothetical protein